MANRAAPAESFSLTGRAAHASEAGAVAARIGNISRGDHVHLQVLLGDQVLALPDLAEDDWDSARGGPGLDPADEPPGHPLRCVLSS